MKCPRSIDFEEELPRLPTGKLYKRVLRDRYWGDGRAGSCESEGSQRPGLRSGGIGSAGPLAQDRTLSPDPRLSGLNSQPANS